MTRFRAKGFTLVELMITVVVAAILLALAAPSFADFFDKYRLRGAADAIVSTVATARAAAVKADRDVNISFDGTTSAWCLGANSAVEPSAGARAEDAKACECSNVASTECVVSGQRLVVELGSHQGVSMSALPAAIVFDSKLGLVQGMQNRSATLTSPAGKYVVNVTVNPLGQAFVCVPTTLPAGKRVLTGVQACPV